MEFFREDRIKKQKRKTKKKNKINMKHVNISINIPGNKGDWNSEYNVPAGKCETDYFIGEYKEGKSIIIRVVSEYIIGEWKNVNKVYAQVFDNTAIHVPTSRTDVPEDIKNVWTDKVGKFEEIFGESYYEYVLNKMSALDARNKIFEYLKNRKSSKK